MDDVSRYDGVIITNLVMAFTELSPTNKDTIHTRLESGKDEQGIHSPGTHNPDSSYIRRVLKAGYPGRVCCGITAPVAKKTEYLGFKGFVRHLITSN
jgi:hypothetical protein